jgi:glutamate 5-kinase
VGGPVVECVDNDETAAQVACLLKSKYLIILTSVDGIYTDPKDPSTIVKVISGKDGDEVLKNIEKYKASCVGSSRAGANGAKAKLEYIKDAVKSGTTVKIANAKYRISDILNGSALCTTIGIMQ